MEIDEDQPPIEDAPPQDVTVEEQPLISLHAMTGSLRGSTIRVEGQTGNRRLHILIDSGSTHSFLDLETARKLGCHCEPLHQLQVTVANGHNMPCKYMCKDFNWMLQRRHYYVDMLLLPLGSYDLILGA